MGSDSTLYQPPLNLQSALLGLIRKEGVQVLMLMAMAWFIYLTYQDRRTDYERLIPILEHNSEVISKNTLIQEQAIAAGENTNQCLREASGIIQRANRIR